MSECLTIKEQAADTIDRLSKTGITYRFAGNIFSRCPLCKQPFHCLAINPQNYDFYCYECEETGSHEDLVSILNVIEKQEKLKTSKCKSKKGISRLFSVR